jgi:hypothetical protein
VPKGRLEAFSDGVIAILITIMVLDLHTPPGTSWDALGHELPVLLAYALTFVYLGIYPRGPPRAHSRPTDRARAPKDRTRLPHNVLRLARRHPARLHRERLV